MNMYDYLYIRKSREVYSEHMTGGNLTKQKAKEDFEETLSIIQRTNLLEYKAISNYLGYEKQLKRIKVGVKGPKSLKKLESVKDDRPNEQGAA